MTDEHFFEICERLREIQAQLFVNKGEKTMLIAQLKDQLNRFFDRAHAHAPGSLTRSVIQRLRAFTLANLDTTQAQLEQLFDDGTFDRGVDFLTAFAKGNLGRIVPWYMRPFVSESKLVDELGSWLKGNAGLFRQGIGELPPK